MIPLKSVLTRIVSWKKFSVTWALLRRVLPSWLRARALVSSTSASFFDFSFLFSYWPACSCKRISAIIRVTRVSNRYSILGEDADQAREKLNGTKLRGNTIRVSLAKVRKSMLLAQLPLTRTGKDDRKEGGQTPEKGPTPGKGPAPVRPKKPSAGDQIAVDSSGM